MSAASPFPNEVMQAPMRKVCEELANRGIDLSKLDALEYFARQGDWQTLSFADKVASLTAWEIDPSHEEALRANLPGADVRIGDAYELARAPEFAGKFDFLSIDNPQVTFGADNEYCEHFEVLPLVPGLMKNEAIVIFDVNYSPYGYEKLPEWERRRKAWYGIEETAQLDFDWLIEFYTRYFEGLGLATNFAFITDRHDGHFAYCVMSLAKNS